MLLFFSLVHSDFEDVYAPTMNNDSKTYDTPWLICASKHVFPTDRQPLLPTPSHRSTSSRENYDINKSSYISCLSILSSSTATQRHRFTSSQQINYNNMPTRVHLINFNEQSQVIVLLLVNKITNQTKCHHVCPACQVQQASIVQIPWNK